MMNNGRLQVDGYVILLDKLIGKGNYGSVFECKSNLHPFINLCAKIMIMHESQQKYQEREKQISEIVSSNRDNQNIVNILYVKEFTDEKKLVIVMERCDSNLQKLWEEKNGFSDSEIMDFLEQFLNGYKVLYLKDIMHRDIKPENILIKFQNQKVIYKLADFGIGKIYKANDFHFTKIGTPAYAAPEINSSIDDPELTKRFISLKNIVHSKSQVDIFSLGVILYQLVFKSFPFEKTPHSITDFLKKLQQTPLKLQSTSEYTQIIEKTLIYYPDERMSFEYLYQYIPQKKLRFSLNVNTNDYKIKQVFKQDIKNRNTQYPKQNGNLFVNNQMMNNQMTINQMMNNQIMNNQIGNNQIVSNQIVNNQIVNNQIVNNQIGNNQVGNNQVGNNQVGNNQVGQFVNNNPVVQFGCNQFNKFGNTGQNTNLRQSFNLTPLNPHQKIKEYLEQILNNYDQLILENFKDTSRLIIKLFDEKNIIPSPQLEQLISFNPFRNEKVNSYDQKTIIYFYCLLSLLCNSNNYNIQNYEENRMREETLKLWNNYFYRAR